MIGAEDPLTTSQHVLGHWYGLDGLADSGQGGCHIDGHSKGEGVFVTEYAGGPS